MTPAMHRFLYILFLFAFLSASAQQMPERREVRKGNRSYHKGDYQKAVERYTQALTYAPGSFEGTYNLGSALCKAEMFDKAEQTMARAAADTLRTDEERAQAFYNLGNAQFLQKKYKEALESYRRSLLLDPADMEAKYNYAYTKKLLDENENQNSENNNNQQQEQEQDKNQQEQSRDNNQEQQDNNEEERDGQQDPSESDQNDKNNNEGQEQPVPAGISEQEQQQMLDAIQAQEDKTQEKLKEKQGVIVRGGKNW
jgi:tetratricopeptide (TPR) repeat protein